MQKPSRDLLKVARPIPILGQVAALACAKETLNQKGAKAGAVDIALDLFPVVGRIKGLFELFSDDIVNQQNLQRGFSTIRRALDEIETLCVDKDSASKDSASNEKVATGVSAATSPVTPSEKPEEERFYPTNSARAALLRAKAAIKPAYESRTFVGLQGTEQEQ